MEIKQFFLERHENLNSRGIPGLLGLLTPDQIRERPHGGVNSIAWLIWHMARCEDVGISLFVGERAQVLDERWMKRLNITAKDIGTGMGDDEVSELSQKVDIDVMLVYRREVCERTQEIVASLEPEDWDVVADPNRVRQLAREQGLVRENAGWVIDENFSANRPKAWFLAQLALTHNYGHLGEAGVVAGLMGVHRR